MEMKFYLEEIQELSRHNNGVVLYPYKDSKKVFNRFEQKIFWMGDKNVVINGWLGEIYKFTDGIDFCNFYIVPLINTLIRKILILMIFVEVGLLTKMILMRLWLIFMLS